MTLVYWGLDLAIVNAFYLWRMQNADNANKPQLGFRQQLIKELLAEATSLEATVETIDESDEEWQPKHVKKRRMTAREMAGYVPRHKASMSWFKATKHQYCTHCYRTTKQEKTPQVQCNGCGDLFCHSVKRDCYAIHAGFAANGHTPE